MIQAALILGGYLVGSIPFGFWLTKVVKGVDVRTVGSGNIGFTNVWRAAGPVLASVVFVLDLLKGLGPALVARHVAPPAPPDLWPLLAGGAAIAGHNWSVFLKFKGGRGVCTTCGVLFAVTPLEATITFGVWLLFVLTTRYVSLGSIAGSLAYPAMIILQHRSHALIVFSILAALAIIIRHIPNIRRLLRGEENRFGKLREPEPEKDGEPAAEEKE